MNSTRGVVWRDGGACGLPGSCRNDLDKPLRREATDKAHRVSPQVVRLDVVVVGHQLGEGAVQALLLFEQLPEAGARGVQAVLDAGPHVEQDHAVAHLLKDDLLRYPHLFADLHERLPPCG